MLHARGKLRRANPRLARSWPTCRLSRVSSKQSLPASHTGTASRRESAKPPLAMAHDTPVDANRPEPNT